MDAELYHRALLLRTAADADRLFGLAMATAGRSDIVGIVIDDGEKRRASPRPTVSVVPRVELSAYVDDPYVESVVAVPLPIGFYWMVVRARGVCSISVHRAGPQTAERPARAGVGR